MVDLETTEDVEILRHAIKNREHMIKHYQQGFKLYNARMAEICMTTLGKMTDESYEMMYVKDPVLYDACLTAMKQCKKTAKNKMENVK